MPCRVRTDVRDPRLIRLLPSRVGFAERDASRPAFGGSSLVSLTRHTCVGGGPLGPRLYVRACVCHVQKRARPHRLSLRLIVPPGGGRKADPQNEALSRGPPLTGASSILKEPVLFFLELDRESFEPQAQPARVAPATS